MYAYIKHSGRQYKVREESTFTIDSQSQLEVGQEIQVTDIPLAVKDDNSVVVNAQGTVTLEIVEHFRTDKLTVLKFRAKKGYRRKKGHRQPYTRVKVKSISIAA